MEADLETKLNDAESLVEEIEETFLSLQSKEEVMSVLERCSFTSQTVFIINRSSWRLKLGLICYVVFLSRHLS